MRVVCREACSTCNDTGKSNENQEPVWRRLYVRPTWDGSMRALQVVPRFGVLDVDSLLLCIRNERQASYTSYAAIGRISVVMLTSSHGKFRALTIEGPLADVDTGVDGTGVEPPSTAPPSPAPTTTTEAPLVDENCFDTDGLCAILAAEGECINNRNWMIFNCRRSCGFCEARTEAPSDRATPAPTTTSQQTTTTTTDATTTTAPATTSVSETSSVTTPGCRDLDAFCEYWASIGECTRNLEWMPQVRVFHAACFSFANCMSGQSV